MALLDFLESALYAFGDSVTSDSSQRNMKRRYDSGKISREEYDKYRDMVDNYKSNRRTGDNDY